VRVARLEVMRNAFKMSAGNLEGNRPMRKWGDNIRMDLTEIRCEGVDRIHLAH